MKRDVKVGLFVAALVCGLAAILLGGGLSAKAPGRPPALSLGGEAPDALPGTVRSTRRNLTFVADGAPGSLRPAPPMPDMMPGGPSASVPTDLTEGLEPPEEFGDETFGARNGTIRSKEPDLRAPTWAAEEADAAADPGTDALEAYEGLAGDDYTTDLFDTPADPIGPPEPKAETPEDLFAAAPSAGDGPMPSPEDAEAAGPGDLEPAVPVGGDATPEETAEDAAGPRKRYYVIRDGESFWTVTKKLYGAGKYYADVVKANPDVNPERIRAGQVIAIPAIDGAKLREELLASPEELEPRSRRPRVYLARDVRHVIRSGETLGDIAQKYYKSAIKWPHILIANPSLDPKRLRAKKEITVPALTEIPGAPRLPDEPRPSARRTTRTPKVYLEHDAIHVVAPGDTLEGVSRKHYGVRHKWSHILGDARNAGLNAKRLRPGDRIVVPALTE